MQRKERVLLSLLNLFREEIENIEKLMRKATIGERVDYIRKIMEIEKIIMTINSGRKFL